MTGRNTFIGLVKKKGKEKEKHMFVLYVSAPSGCCFLLFFWRGLWWWRGGGVCSFSSELGHWRFLDLPTPVNDVLSPISLLLQ